MTKYLVEKKNGKTGGRMGELLNGRTDKWKKETVILYRN
jgi:hypothetical protein